MAAVMWTLSSSISLVSVRTRRASSRRVSAAAPAGSQGSETVSWAQRRNSAGLPKPVIDSRNVGSARTRTALSWLMAWLRDLIAEALASLNIRSISTCPSPDLAIAVARPDSTARAAVSASRVSVLPRRRRSPRSPRLTSITVIVSASR